MDITSLRMGCIAVIALAASRPAAAQSVTTGAIEGRVTAADTGEPLAGVTVRAVGPRSEPQTAITEGDGTYKITELVPGLSDGVGVAISGSTGLENRFLVDGVDITGLTYGDLGTPVLSEFIEELELISGGYNAEWAARSAASSATSSRPGSTWCATPRTPPGCTRAARSSRTASAGARCA